MQFNIPYTHVTVTALQPNTSYFLRVTAENGVSHLHGPNSNRNAEIQFGTKISGADGTFILSLSLSLSLSRLPPTPSALALLLSLLHFIPSFLPSFPFPFYLFP